MKDKLLYSLICGNIIYNDIFCYLLYKVKYLYIQFLMLVALRSQKKSIGSFVEVVQGGTKWRQSKTNLISF